MKPVIELRDVTFGYTHHPVLKKIDLHLHPGQLAAVVGPSGAGKTSLLKLILGTLQPVRGSVKMNVQQHSKQQSNRLARRVAYVPQVDTIDWNFPVTVEEVVLMGRIRNASIWPWPSRADREQMAGVLQQLEIDALAKDHISDLSGGQQQRVFLARALMAEPDLLVLDEPTSGVDMKTAESMLHLLLHLNQNGMTILMTTHDLNLAAAHVPWVICLNQEIIAQGAPEEIFTSEILNQTYQSDMMVMRQDGMIFVHQRPHSHTLREVIPDPVLGHLPDAHSVIEKVMQPNIKPLKKKNGRPITDESPARI